MVPRSQILKILGLLLVSLLPTSGQNQIGIDICSCAPSSYEFEFDFGLSCPPINVTQGDAISSTTCMTSPFLDESVADKVPVLVQTIDVLELDQNLDVMTREQIVGNFRDGDRFKYTSVAAQSGETDYTKLPRSIQYNIVGINANEDPIVNLVVITFSNSCQAYPVLIPGQYAGWVRFVSITQSFLSIHTLVPRFTKFKNLSFFFTFRLTWKTLYTSTVPSFLQIHLPQLPI